MFLIEYKSGCFINGELIDWIKLTRKGINFTISGDSESGYVVDEDYQFTFVNNLQAINQNISSIETAFKSKQVIA